DDLLERQVRATLRDVPPVPGHLLGSALARAAATSQSRPWRHRILPRRPSWTAVSLTAVLAVGVAAVLAWPTHSARVSGPAMDGHPDAGTWSGMTELPEGNWSYG